VVEIGGVDLYPPHADEAAAARVRSMTVGFAADESLHDDDAADCPRRYRDIGGNYSSSFGL
jgi:hypothetical protein